MSQFEEVCKKIQDLYIEMKELTLAAGVSEETYNKVIDIHPDISLGEVQNRLKFLETIREGIYSQLNYTWLLLPPFVWQGYLDMGIRGYPEQKQLRSQRKYLKEAWIHKYEKGQRLKKVEENQDESLHSDEIGQLSGGTGSVLSSGKGSVGSSSPMDDAL